MIRTGNTFRSIGVKNGSSSCSVRQRRLKPTSVKSLGNATAVEDGIDVVLSSGFLAFAAHCGFLQAVKDLGFKVKGVMGTSSGALTGSMFAAGYTPEEIALEFSRIPPIKRISMSKRPWNGLFTLDPVAERLQELIPARFEDLGIDFACGVVGVAGYELVDSGNLAEAVVASAAVPVLFHPVHIPGNVNGPHIDGGVATRVGLDEWRERCLKKKKTSRPAVVHVVGRSSPFSGSDGIDGRKDIALVCSPRSRESLWEMRHFEPQFEATYTAALPILQNFLSTPQDTIKTETVSKPKM